MTEVSRFRVVLDTNVILAALLSRNPASPTVELLHRWRNGEFALLYCTDLLLEYHPIFAQKSRKAKSILSSTLTTEIASTILHTYGLPKWARSRVRPVVMACA